jgi:hypothetical protein
MQIENKNAESSWRCDPVGLCSSIISEIVDRCTIESESASFYRKEIEKCQEYISFMQAEATHTW